MNSVMRSPAQMQMLDQSITRLSSDLSSPDASSFTYSSLQDASNALVNDSADVEIDDIFTLLREVVIVDESLDSTTKEIALDKIDILTSISLEEEQSDLPKDYKAALLTLEGIYKS